MFENLPVWLQRAGYRTIGFRQVHEQLRRHRCPAETVVPAGWDQWVSDATDNSTREFYGYRQNVNGTVTARLGWPYYDQQGGRDPEGCPRLDRGLQLPHGLDVPAGRSGDPGGR